ncbi:MAG: hypothetical protein ABSG65_21845 [Bryobacteraceae bacterium]|jgi:hypothetical protein
MPTVAYEQHLAETMPARVQNEEEYDLIRSRFGDLLSRRRTVAEDKLMDLLGVLIEDYDRRHSLPPEESTPLGEDDGRSDPGIRPGEPCE